MKFLSTFGKFIWLFYIVISFADFGDDTVEGPIMLILLITDCVLSKILDTGIARLLTKFCYSANYACLSLILPIRSVKFLKLLIWVHLNPFLFLNLL